MFNIKNSPSIIRKINTAEKKIFLTFDDGPESPSTAEILDILKSENWPATFFVVGHRAEKNSTLIKRMLTEGHNVMSHSYDHAYYPHFFGTRFVKNWVTQSLIKLSHLTGLEQIAFRPPAGVITPPLVRAAQDLKVPLILWNYRYFDSNSNLTLEKIQKHLNQLSNGDIVLLHDRQAPGRQKIFMKTLVQYIHKMKELGYKGGALSNELIRQQISFK